MQSTLDKSGRVVIPKPLRDWLQWAPGTALSVEERNGAVVIEPARKEPGLVRKSGLLIHAGEAVGDLLGAVVDHRQERLREAAAWKSE